MEIQAVNNSSHKEILGRKKPKSKIQILLFEFEGNAPILSFPTNFLILKQYF